MVYKKSKVELTNEEIRNLPEHSPDICDDIEWFVEVLGVIDILIKLVNDSHYISAREGSKYAIYNKNDSELPTYSNGRAKIYLPNGLIFDGSHWYFKKDGVIVDSYKLKHQVKGTAHFCQTFSLMYYLASEMNIPLNLKENDYTHNIRKAIEFWAMIFENNTSIRKQFLYEVHNYWGKMTEENELTPIQIVSIPLKKRLKNITYNDLKKFMAWMYNNADSFINCKQTC